MADFQSQAMGLTDLTIDASSTVPSRSEFSQFLNDGVIDVTNRWLIIKPEDVEDFTLKCTKDGLTLDKYGIAPFLPKSQIQEVPVEKEVIKYKDNPLLNHPRVQNAIKHARRAGEL